MVCACCVLGAAYGTAGHGIYTSMGVWKAPRIIMIESPFIFISFVVIISSGVCFLEKTVVKDLDGLPGQGMS